LNILLVKREIATFRGKLSPARDSPGFRLKREMKRNRNIVVAAIKHYIGCFPSPLFLLAQNISKIEPAKKPENMEVWQLHPRFKL
jgi:hypothetical protein